MSQFSAVASAGWYDNTTKQSETHAANSTRLILLSHANDSPLPLLVFSNILFLPSIILIKAYHMVQIYNFYCFYWGIHFCPLPFLLSLKHIISQKVVLYYLSFVSVNGHAPGNRACAFQYSCVQRPEAQDLLGATVTAVTWVLRVELWSSARSLYAFHHWTLSPAPKYIIYDHKLHRYFTKHFIIV